MTVREVIEKIDYMTYNMFREDFNIYNELKEILKYIQKYYEEFIELIPRLNKIGMSIDMMSVVGQIKTLSDALEKRDGVIAFDTLKYEVKDTLGLYGEIKEIMEQE